MANVLLEGTLRVNHLEVCCEHNLPAVGDGGSASFKMMCVGNRDFGVGGWHTLPVSCNHTAGPLRSPCCPSGSPADQQPLVLGTIYGVRRYVLRRALEVNQSLAGD